MLVIVAENEDDIDTRIKSLIHNVGLFNEAKHMYDQLKPTANALDKLQKDSSSIAYACETWLGLLESE